MSSPSLVLPSSSSSSAFPQHLEDALNTIDSSLEVINNYVEETSEESTKVHEVFPSQLVLFSNNQANAFHETLLTFRRVLNDTLTRCSRVRQIMDDSSEKISIVLMHRQIDKNRTTATTTNAEGEDQAQEDEEHEMTEENDVDDDNDTKQQNTKQNKQPEQQKQEHRHQHHKPPRPSSSSSSAFLTVANDIQQQTVRVAPETSDSSEMRMLNQLFKQVSENESTSEIFAEMAIVAKSLEDLRHNHDLNKVYKARAEELQSQIGIANNNNNNNNNNAASSLQLTKQFNSRASSVLSSTNEAAAGTTGTGTGNSNTNMNVNVVTMANDFGRLTTKMKEKWELAEADRALAEANVIALESENALLASRVKDLEERLVLSSNAAAERKVLLERERSRSAKLLSATKNQRASSAGSSCSSNGGSDSDTNNNNNNEDSGTARGINSERTAGTSHHNRQYGQRPPLRAGSAKSTENRVDDSLQTSPKSQSLQQPNQQQNRSSVLHSAANSSIASSIAKVSSSSAKTSSTSAKPNSANDNVATDLKSSGICIDGVELSQEFAVWMAKVHRLLLKDNNAQEALFDLEKEVAADKKNDNKSTKNDKNNSKTSTVETPFQKFMKTKGR